MGNCCGKSYEDIEIMDAVNQKEIIEIIMKRKGKIINEIIEISDELRTPGKTNSSYSVKC